MLKKTLAFPALIALLALPAFADDSLNTGPDGHAPIGVMGDHIHHSGELMLSYRYMEMEMDGNRDGSSERDPSEVLANFMVTPLRMTTKMHMLGAMYAVSEQLTLFGMLPHIEKDMDHVTRMGVNFKTESGGIGDVKLGGLYQIWGDGHQSAHLNLGVSLPTGSINEKDSTPASGGVDVRLPYPMQIGSGTFDLMPGVTWRGKSGPFSYGAQAKYTARMGENENEYTLGDVFDITGWGAYRIHDIVSASLRLAYKDWDNIDGEDDVLTNVPDMMIPTVREDLRGGSRWDVGVGVNVAGNQNMLPGWRVALEYLTPIDQDLDGPQLQSDGMFVVGVQWTPIRH